LHEAVAAIERFPVEGLKTVEANGTALAYLERGSGESVVFVHGSSQDLRTWLHQIDDVSSAHRAIIYSRRYARPNEDIPPGQDDQMLPHVDDLLTMLRTLDAAPAHLVGSSWGAFICLLAAIREPSMVRTLTLCEPPVLPLFISNQPKPAELLKLLFTRPIDAIRIMRFGLGVVEPTAKAYRKGDVERGGEIFGAAVLGKEGMAAMPPERRRMLEENTAAEVAQFLGAGFPPLRAADVRAVRAPALLVAGERSHPVLSKTLTGALERLMPNARRVEITDASHLMHEEQPAAFNTALLSFLRTHQAA
jgi:pimeloyl-ACP methyl ester carboxylesterase